MQHSGPLPAVARRLGAALIVLAGPLPAAAATQSGAPPPIAGLPFAGVLASIALFPILAPRFWHRHMGAIALAWTLALLLPEAATLGPEVSGAALAHAVLLEYLPFVSLLFALYVIGGGILVQGGPAGTPSGNTVLLAIGVLLAGVMGTTGVSMVLIHPLLRANAHRRRKVHIVVFFIVLVANAGGATSPLGDPPLYIGFLLGVPFFWPLKALALPLVLVALPLLAAFYLIDRRFAAGDPSPKPAPPFHMRGLANLPLLVLVVAMVLVQGVWDPGVIVLFGQVIGIDRLAGIGVFLAAGLGSLALTPRAVRQGNMFAWDPIAEVAKLFFAIFVTIAPVLAMLDAGKDGPLGFLLGLTENRAGLPIPLVYFWLTGILSAFLDNAPTYLVFFQQAGGDAALLTGALSRTLAAISAGAVFFGGLTYIGNAPNMMLRAIASHRGVRMPGFFVYIALSTSLLLPTLLLVGFVCFR